jgi:2-oxoglutarate ferredoxin oxidoreductase subunit beta
MLATLAGTKYLARGAVNNAANVRKTKGYIKKAFEAQMRGEGSSIVEILSQCPTNWAISPVESVGWVESAMIPFYALGVVKDELAPVADTVKEASK